MIRPYVYSRLEWKERDDENNEIRSIHRSIDRTSVRSRSATNFLFATISKYRAPWLSNSH